MSLWDNILASSGLEECRSIADHLCSAMANGSTRVFFSEKYNINYIGEESVCIAYLPVKTYNVDYLGEENTTISYKEETKYRVTYLGENLININYEC